MIKQLFCLFSLLAVLLLSPLVAAQQSKQFGPYELHYSVVNTTFLEPKVAAAYGITRGDNRAILNLSVREHLADGTEVARSMLLKGRSWDLIQQTQELDFIEVREESAIYSIAEVKFQNEEWRHFEVHFRPEGATEPTPSKSNINSTKIWKNE